MNNVQGIGIGSGKSWGRVFRISKTEVGSLNQKSTETEDLEFQRLSDAIGLVISELRAGADKTSSSTQDILAALATVLEDPELLSGVRAHLTEGWNAETALTNAMKQYTSQLEGIPGFEERISDLEGLVNQVIAKLLNISPTNIPIDGPVVVVAEDLTPMETTAFGKNVVGVITKNGGPTSHTAIICRQLGIPALVATKVGFELLEDGLGVLIDASKSEAVITEESKLSDGDVKVIKVGEPLVPVLANISSAHDAEIANVSKANGVGLFRTELLFLGRQSEPTVEEQQAEYAKVFQSAPAGELIVRTLDYAEDKPIHFLKMRPDSANTVLNQHPEVVVRQLQAIRKAADSSGVEVAVMAPMVRTELEVQEFRRFATDAGFKQIGVMVETSELAGNILSLKNHVSFVSIGTNDLSSDLFEQDRLAPGRPELLDPWQPKLLEVIANIVNQAKEVGLKVGVCGEAAADPVLSLVLAGLGVDSVSVATSALHDVRTQLGTVSMEQAQELARVALAGGSVQGSKRAVATLLQGFQG